MKDLCFRHMSQSKHLVKLVKSKSLFQPSRLSVHVYVHKTSVLYHINSSRHIVSAILSEVKLRKVSSNIKTTPMYLFPGILGK